MKILRLLLGILISFIIAQSCAKRNITVPIDISSTVNMGFTDEVRGDSIGGWTDDGPRNDIRNLVPVDCYFGSIGFKIIDPGQNGGKSCIVLSGPGKEYFPDNVNIKMSGEKLTHLYLLHATSTVPPYPVTVGQISVTYKNGDTNLISIKSYQDVNNWWYPEDLPNAAVGWKGVNFYSDIGLYVSKHKINPEPIKSIEIKTTQSGVWMIAAISGSMKDFPLPFQKTRITGKENLITSVSDPILEDNQVTWTGKTGAGKKIKFALCQDMENSFRLFASGGEIEWKGAAHELADLLDSTELNLEKMPVNLVKEGNVWTISSLTDGNEVYFKNKGFELVFTDLKNNLYKRLYDFLATDEVIGASGDIGDNECIYGTGQRFNGVNQRGKRVRIWSEDRFPQTEGNSYVPIPLIMSTEGYGLYLNRFEYSEFDLGVQAEDKWSFQQHDAPMDCYIFLDKDPKKILKKYAQLTGFAPLPPAWSFENWISRYAGGRWVFSKPEGVYQYLKEMEELDIPVRTIIIEGWPTYNTDKWGELKEMCRILHMKGKKVIVYDQCGRLRTTETDPYLNPGIIPEDDYFVQDSLGNIDIFRWFSYKPMFNPGGRKVSFIDLTNPEAVNWWYHDVMKTLLSDIGIDGAKIDFCEWFPEGEELQFHSGRNPKGMHHLYPVLFNAWSYRNFQHYRPEGGVCWSRGGGIGAQRYPFLWCGDQNREFYYLRPVLSAKLSSGLSGIPFMGNDLGGFSPTSNPVERARQDRIFIRAAQMDCFGIAMECHGQVQAPYEFDEETINIFRKYARIHYALIPYIIEYAVIATKTGVPLLRHLYLEFPGDERVWEIEDQYMYGSDILVAPVLDDVKKRDVYLPEGEWVDLNTGKVYIGRQELQAYPAPLEKIPVFYRKKMESEVLPGLISIMRSHLN